MLMNYNCSARMGSLQFLLFGILAIPSIQAYMKITSQMLTTSSLGSYRNLNPQCSNTSAPTSLFSCWHGDIQDAGSCITAGCCFSTGPTFGRVALCTYPPGFEKVKCLPDDAGAEACLRAGCHWRAVENTNIPKCFKPPYNTKYKKFGYNPVQCLADSRSHQIVNSDNHEIPCQIESQTESSCTGRGCCWVTHSDTSSCIYPKYDFVPCFPDEDGNVLENTCTAKGCHWISDPLQSSGNPLQTKCFYPLNYKNYRTADVPQCFDEGYTVQDRDKCEIMGDLNEMNCRAKGCCWQPVLHNTSAHYCYYPWNSRQKPVQDLSTCSDERLTKNPSNRFDCFPRGIPNEKTCNARGCCWNPSQGKGPSCFYPMTHKSYEYNSTVSNDTKGMSLTYQIKIPAPYPDNIEFVKMDIEYETKTRVRVKIYDSNNVRYEPPYPKINKKSNETVKDKLYEVETGQTSFGFAIKRSGSNQILFDTRNVGGFIMSDQFLQISAKLPSTHVPATSADIFGLGLQISKSLKNKFDWSILSLFAHGQSSSHPFYLSLEDNGQAHGVFLLNSNALEIAFQPTPAITYRATGGILDFYFFMGDTPSDVIMQYLDLIGKPHMPPYWALGHQLYQQGVKDVKTYQGLVEKRKYPLDVVYGDQLYLDFNSDPTSTNKFREDLNKDSIKYISIVQPGIQTRNNTGSVITRGEGEEDIYTGKLSLDRTDIVYLDFTNPNISSDWQSIVSTNLKTFPFNGLYLDNNEPFNSVNPVKCPLTRFDDPTFVPKLMNVEHQELKQNTICMSAVQHAGVHYNVHNLYGLSQAHITYDVLKSMLNVRPFVLSKSTFPGSGVYSGHWIEYKDISWNTMKQSITDMILMNMYGVPMVGAKAFFTSMELNNTELLTRWAALGAFYPLSLTKSSVISTKDESLNEVVVNRFLTLRYQLLPYLYTVMYNAHRFGHMVIRPLFFEYPKDVHTRDIDDQFFWGENLLITPVLKEGVAVLEAYVPEGLWYKYPSLEPLISIGKKYLLNAGLAELPMLFKGGSIIVTHQTPRLTTQASRKSKFDIVALLDPERMSERNMSCHRGQFHWDDGETNDENNHFNIDFYFNEFTFVISGKKPTKRTPDEMLINSIQIHRLVGKIRNVRIRLGKDGNQEKYLKFDHKQYILNINASDAGFSFWEDITINIEYWPFGAPTANRESLLRALINRKS